MAALLAGVPVTAGATACNRQCSSGLQAIAAAAGMIRLGAYDAAIAGGFESMSQLEQQPPTMDYSSLESDKRAADCAIPMGDTSEVVAKRYSVSREDQDRVAAESQRRAEAAQTGGLYDDEIVPVTVPPEDGEGPGTTVTKDDGIRAGTTAEKLARLRPAFDPEGASTAGNSSQVSDGAAAVLLMRRGRFDALGLKGRVQPLGVLRSFVVVGVEPDEMGVGPAYAIPPALRRAGVRSDEIDAFEINEAFASQYLYCLRALKLDDKKVNPLGGAIALGHPLGCTGCRQVVTLLHHLRRTKGKYGVVSMCIGTGMGAAAVFEREE